MAPNEDGSRESGERKRDAVRAVVWDGSELTVRDDVRLRRPGANEVVIEIDVAGLCHSDLKSIEGDSPQDLPVVLGHEATGHIVDRGPAVTLALGTRVAVTTLRSCGTCAECQAGHRNRCADSVTTPRTPFLMDGAELHQYVRLGAFARRTLVSASQAIPMPAGLSDQVTAMLSCATVTAFGAVEERARVQAGETALIVGAGGVGLNATIAAKAAGASRVVVCDRNPRKEFVARQCGADVFLLVGGTSIVESARAMEPNGYDVILECVGRVDLLEQAVSCLGRGGRVVIVGVPPQGASFPLEARSLFYDKSVLGCRMGSVDPTTALPRLAERCLRGEFDLEPLVSATVAPGEVSWLVGQLQAGLLERGFIDFRLEDAQ